MVTNTFDLPTVVGALNCTHFEIKKATNFGDEYINRKGFVQATCDEQERFTNHKSDLSRAQRSGKYQSELPLAISAGYDGVLVATPHFWRNKKNISRCTQIQAEIT
ncbi:hypothetical protein J6590_083761 [Homalodisca vitripennis]|nr:hypothetical protein J6590_083761 [Homalodisca vitripennis]